MSDIYEDEKKNNSNQERKKCTITYIEKEILNIYTEHGYLFINHFLRGIDNFNSYSCSLTFVNNLYPIIYNIANNNVKNDNKNKNEYNNKKQFISFQQRKLYDNQFQRRSADDLKVLREIMLKYIKRLYNIIDKCPTYKTNLKVYRGSAVHHLKQDSNYLYHLMTFTSSSFNSSVANKFTDNGRNNDGMCIYIFHVNR
jgi:hypothetical protein